MIRGGMWVGSPMHQNANGEGFCQNFVRVLTRAGWGSLTPFIPLSRPQDSGMVVAEMLTSRGKSKNLGEKTPIDLPFNPAGVERYRSTTIPFYSAGGSVVYRHSGREVGGLVFNNSMLNDSLGLLSKYRVPASCGKHCHF